MFNAHLTDPETSYEAFQAHVASGAHEAQCRAVLAAVERWPGRTSSELAAMMGVDRHMPARRLSDLADKQGTVRRGPKRKPMIDGREGRLNEVTWWPVTEGYTQTELWS